jgi:hypothetical protein
LHDGLKIVDLSLSDIFSIERTLTGGSLKTVEFAMRHKKPYLHIGAGDRSAAEQLELLVESHGVKVPNVPGPRASKEHGGEFVIRTLEKAFSGRLR